MNFKKGNNLLSLISFSIHILQETCCLKIPN
jgi:hypothetical protein